MDSVALLLAYAVPLLTLEAYHLMGKLSESVLLPVEELTYQAIA